MFKLMRKEINAILGTQTILNWTYELLFMDSGGTPPIGGQGRSAVVENGFRVFHMAKISEFIPPLPTLARNIS